MKNAFSEENRKKVMAMHLRPMSEAEMKANDAICRTCAGIGHRETPEDGFFRALCPSCDGSGMTC